MGEIYKKAEEGDKAVAIFNFNGLDEKERICVKGRIILNPFAKNTDITYIFVANREEKSKIRKYNLPLHQCGSSLKDDMGWYIRGYGITDGVLITPKGQFNSLM